MNILILVPQLDKPGGVANYYTALKSKFNFKADYFVRGTRQHWFKVPTVLTYLYDYVRFFLKLITSRHDLYVLNTSLAYAGCTRDKFFILLCRLFRRKFIVFFRGWNQEFADDIAKGRKREAIKPFIDANAIIVLAEDFKRQLRTWGYSGRIYIETTVVDSDLFKNVNFSYLDSKYNYKPNINLLFLARVVKEKGVYEILQALSLLQKSDLPFTFKFTLAGTGPDLGELKSRAEKAGLDNISFTGHISGDNKKLALKEADIFLFPTNHGEGMPNSLLEAMAFGLPVLTRPVGGIKDFFEDKKMGRMTLSTDPVIYAEILKEMASDLSNLQDMAKFNHAYALERFSSEKVVKRLENIFNEVVSQ